MRFKHRFAQFSVLFAVLFLGQAFAERQLNLAVASELLEAKDCSVLYLEFNVLALDPGSIIAQKNGIFLTTNAGELIQIPALFSDLTGCYTIVNPEGASTVYVLLACSNCGKKHVPTSGLKSFCPFCKK